MKTLSYTIRFYISIALIFTCTLDIHAQETDYSTLKAEMTEFIQKEMKKKKIQGLSVALVDDQQTIWAEGFGWQHKSEDKAASEHSVYRVGSITKLFTATAIMQLVEQGKIDLDKTIDNYIPGFSIKSRFDNPDPITVRSLLTHQSGLPSDYFYNFFFDNPPPEDYAKEYLRLPDQIKDEYVATQPWYNFSYCNLGFSLLGNIITHVSGQDYVDYVNEHILDQLGMANSSVILDDRVKKNMSMGYFGRKEFHTPYIRDLAAGSLLSSSSDMTAFMKMIFADGTYNGNQILEKETLHQMFERQNKDVELDLDFGIGITYWLENPTGIEEVQPVSHGGDLPPFHAMLIMIPDYKLGAIALSNSNSSTGTLRDFVVQTLQKALALKAGLEVPEEDETEKTYIELSDDQLNKYSGLYATQMGLFNFKPKKDVLVAKQSVLKIHALPYSDTEFDLKLKLLGIPIAKEMAQKVNMDYHYLDNMDLMALYYEDFLFAYAQKVEPVDIPQNWQNRIGKYEVVNLNVEDYSKTAQRFLVKNAEMKMDKKTGFLMITYKMMGQPISMALNPINDAEAINIGLGRSMGETLRVFERDGAEIITFSGYEFKKTK